MLLDLQRDAGNRAVSALLQRDKADSGDNAKKAENVFHKAEKAYTAGQFGVATDLFAKADELRHIPEISFDWAQALRRAGGHADEAICQFQIYIDERPGGKRVKDATDSIAELNGPQPSGDRKVDGRAAEKAFRKGEKAHAAGEFMAAADFFGQADAIWHIPEISFDWAQALRRAGGHADEAICQFQIYIDERPSGNRVKDAVGAIAELTGPQPSGDRKVDGAAAEKAFRKGEKAHAAARSWKQPGRTSAS